MPNRRLSLVDDVVEYAQAQIGFLAGPNRTNAFGARLGYDGKPWDGAFLETVFRTPHIEAGVSLTSSTAALAYFTRANRIFHAPKRGDIVFFGWSTGDDGFGQPHVGLVTEAPDWKSLRKFRTVEANISSGLPRGSRDTNGVYDRTRYEADCIGFGRPLYRIDSTLTATAPEDRPVLRIASLQPGKKNGEVEILQQALADRLSLRGFDRGKYDAHTKSAVLAFQRQIGYVTATGDGTPDQTTLNILARQTGWRYFTA